MSSTQVQVADLPRSGYCHSGCGSDAGSTTSTTDGGPSSDDDSSSITSNSTTATTTTNGCSNPDDGSSERATAGTNTSNGGPFSENPFCLMVYVDDEMTACEEHLKVIRQQREVLLQNEHLAARCAENVKKAEEELRRVAAFARECKMSWTYAFLGKTLGEDAKAARREQEAKLRSLLSGVMYKFESARLRCERTRGVVGAIRRALEALRERANGPWGVVSELRERQVEVYQYSDSKICIKVRHEGEPPRTEVLEAHKRGGDFWMEQKELMRDVLEMERVLMFTATKCVVAAGEVRGFKEKGLEGMIRGVKRVVDAMKKREASENGCETSLWGNLRAVNWSRMRFW
ncbi:hypothetical protein CGMCC3_g14010 [Colletotrichum fructicola]|uniref:Uncharacterized protein n=2 Tax=Colletotrichum fructicola (strain Nara gc5) TaxID=1213859 RepID=A0A7J6IZQ5_COLFN|nr:uncharacterized protein CGMCC3_g14010 [Colletotrichum fructicola]KAE9569862.1 hypothetical protein CGMCC3_g14010 [Colletotrichum fructicola]KAF4418382.1 hypothetical protein CFRS1_v008382 [Colletotrichum fructicola]KAF4481881.1 hypothetical protein CGGC5_v009620 [Colletotrichum fructicola Nara gc5]KAF4899468.1 hypothetical protein CGCFRS4_v003929 [Colletotrichum fructicola]